MTEEFTVQCENCGTLYSDQAEVCPYCGQPQPLEYEQPGAAYDYTTIEDLTGDPYAVVDDLLYEEQQSQEVYLEDAPPGGIYEDGDYPGGDDAPYGWPTGAEAYEQDYEFYSLDDDDLDDDEPLPRRITLGRMVMGCLGLFACISLLYGTVALVAAYNGLRERAANTQVEAQQHYDRGQEHLTNNQLDLAIAEFQMALSLNPNLLAARQALREAQSVAQAQPTPTSETRSAAAALALETAETQVEEENWAEAVQTLVQVRDLDPDYQAARVSELLYTAAYQLGLLRLAEGQTEEAAAAFEQALNEQPADTAAEDELAKASLYLEGLAAETTDKQKAVDAFSLLYRQDPDYLDVKERLARAHEQRGDELTVGGDWCLAEVQYQEATELHSSAGLEDKIETSSDRCQEDRDVQTSGGAPSVRPTPTPRAVAAAQPAMETTEAVTPTTEAGETAPAPTGGSSVVYSAYNPAEKRWEMLAAPVGGGSPRLLATDGTMPAISPNGQLLLYRSELIESEGFHIFNLAAGEDSRITLRRYHILPRWGGDDKEYLFVAEEPATGRWQVWLGFADGKGEPVILRDGRTPDWSPDKSQIAYQGTDPEGNNPGIYLAPYGGGEPTRVTTHESDRSPDFSPDGSRLAYMSTQEGSWNIYVVGVNGGQPRRLTTGGGNHGLPAWSPDGSQIAYVSDTGGSWAIYVVSASGGSPTRVVAWDPLNRPDWLLDQISWLR